MNVNKAQTFSDQNDAFSNAYSSISTLLYEFYHRMIRISRILTSNFGKMIANIIK